MNSNKQDYIIRREEPKDYLETENLVRDAFWNIYRPGCLEHYVLHTLRDKNVFVPELDYIMVKDEKIIGQVVFVRAQIVMDNGNILPIMTFGPVSIAPEFKGKGYGKKLLEYSINEAEKLGVGALCIEGDFNFYSKLGFVVASEKEIHYYAEKREEVVPYFLLKELKQGFLNDVSGTYYTPKEYFVDVKEAEEFDLLFPHKEKLKLPGQLI